MKANAETLRVRLRSRIRLPVALWKRWREPRLAAAAKHELAICAIFREEAAILHEWIEFHVAIGVTQFYLYNNFSTDGFAAVLKPWIARGLVTLIDWPAPVGQISAFADCLRRFRNEARWIAFIDVDEFLFSPHRVDVRPVIASYAHWPGIEVWQLFFGSSGNVQRPDALVVDTYIRRAPVTRTTVKTIVNPRMVYKPGIHQFKFWFGRGLDTSGQIVTPATTPVFDKLRINHYWSRSIEELETKIRRGDASSLDSRRREWHLEFEQSLNSESDTTIQTTVSEIRRRRHARVQDTNA